MRTCVGGAVVIARTGAASPTVRGVSNAAAAATTVMARTESSCQCRSEQEAERGTRCLDPLDVWRRGVHPGEQRRQVLRPSQLDADEGGPRFAVAPLDVLEQRDVVV